VRDDEPADEHVARLNRLADHVGGELQDLKARLDVSAKPIGGREHALKYAAATPMAGPLLVWSDGSPIEDPRESPEWEPGEPEFDIWPEWDAADEHTPAGADGIGVRTALDLLHGTPPPQLVHPFLTPEGPTVLYAKGGTGKGLMACWLTRELVRSGHVVAIVDFEGHEREWGGRLRGMGLTETELSQIPYRAPFGDDWTARRGSLADVAELLREDFDRLGVTYLVVDSYTVATSTGDTMGGQPAAQEYFTALTRIGRPSLTLAHVRGDAERFPDKPFGSVFVHNLARETWPVEQTAQDEEFRDDDPAVERLTPAVVSLELRNKKASDREKAAPQFMTFSFYADGTIEVGRAAPKCQSLVSMAQTILTGTAGMNVKNLVAAIREDFDVRVSEDTLGKKLRVHTSTFAKSGARPFTWTVIS
jgi:hypothetical protein